MNGSLQRGRKERKAKIYRLSLLGKQSLQPLDDVLHIFGDFLGRLGGPSNLDGGAGALSEENIGGAESLQDLLFHGGGLQGDGNGGPTRMEEG